MIWLDDEVRAVNCQACGIECDRDELQTIKLSGFTQSISVCDSCLKQSAEESFKCAAEILNDIIKIAKSEKDPERRLRQIKTMI